MNTDRCWWPWKVLTIYDRQGRLHAGLKEILRLVAAANAILVPAVGAAGFTTPELERMMCHNPASLLGFADNV